MPSTTRKRKDLASAPSASTDTASSPTTTTGSGGDGATKRVHRTTNTRQLSTSSSCSLQAASHLSVEGNYAYYISAIELERRGYWAKHLTPIELSQLHRHLVSLESFVAFFNLASTASIGSSPLHASLASTAASSAASLLDTGSEPPSTAGMLQSATCTLPYYTLHAPVRIDRTALLLFVDDTPTTVGSAATSTASSARTSTRLYSLDLHQRAQCNTIAQSLGDQGLLCFRVRSLLFSVLMQNIPSVRTASPVQQPQRAYNLYQDTAGPAPPTGSNVHAFPPSLTIQVSARPSATATIAMRMLQQSATKVTNEDDDYDVDCDDDDNNNNDTNTNNHNDCNSNSSTTEKQQEQGLFIDWKSVDPGISVVLERQLGATVPPPTYVPSHHHSPTINNAS
jgi:hypothetical protein